VAECVTSFVTLLVTLLCSFIRVSDYLLHYSVVTVVSQCQWWDVVNYNQYILYLFRLCYNIYYTNIHSCTPCNYIRSQCYQHN
jgi:hypothetical protein